jgi:hypothetical protein
MKLTRKALTIFVSTCLAAISGGASAQTSAAPADTGYVTYDDSPISLPLGVGLSVPSYDRVNGLSLPWGPMITLSNGRVEIDPTVTYRSNIGDFDPYAKATIRLSPRDALRIAGGRATFSNDSWIRSDIVNSLAVIGVGSDSRNYFRADRVTGDLSHEFISPGQTITPRIGMLHENAWSTGEAVPHSNAPWSFFGKSDRLKMQRINPAILKGHTTSATAGINYNYDLDQTTALVDLNFEHAFTAPDAEEEGESEGYYNQITGDAKATFPTFGTQSFTFRGHTVYTPGDPATPQRFAYLGGAGTLATVDLLALGGDRLVYVEGEYDVPLVGPLLPFVGAPIVGVRYAAGSAGVGTLPSFIQNIGVTLGVKFIKAEYHIDPNYKKTPFTRRHAFSIGLSL